MNEFELIRTFFAAPPVTRDDVAVGIGDDAAVLDVPAGMQLVTTTDVLVSGVHFFPDDDPAGIGHKSLAVNLSDLAAMGAEPAWFTLGISLPHVDTAWLRAFCAGLFDLARHHRVQLVGGDTVRGPLSIAVAAYGLVPRARALRRSGARAGDRIYVTGEIGDAGLGLCAKQGKYDLPDAARAAVHARLARPSPRVEAGQALRDVASSAIDISDGLLADLGHVLAASHVGATVKLPALPLSAVYRSVLARVGWDIALSGGDDYELCVTVAPGKVDVLEKLKPALACGLTCIGDIVAAPGLRILDASGQPYRPAAAGFDHFAHT